MKTFLRICFWSLVLLAGCKALHAQTFDDFGGLITYTNGAPAPVCAANPAGQAIVSASQSTTTQTVVVSDVTKFAVGEPMIISGTGTAMDWVYSGTDAQQGASIITAAVVGTETLTLTSPVSVTVGSVPHGTIAPGGYTVQTLNVFGGTGPQICTPEHHWQFRQFMAGASPSQTGTTSALTTKYGSICTAAQNLQNEWDANLGFNGVGELSDAQFNPSSQGTCGSNTKVPYAFDVEFDLYFGTNNAAYSAAAFQNINDAIPSFLVGQAGNPQIDYFSPNLPSALTKRLQESSVVKTFKAPLSAFFTGGDTDFTDFTGGTWQFHTFVAGINKPNEAYKIAVSSPMLTVGNNTFYGNGLKKPLIFNDPEIYGKLPASGSACTVTNPCTWPDFLKDRYTTIGAVNTAWGTSSYYTTFGSSGACAGYTYTWCGSQIPAETLTGSGTSWSVTLSHTTVSAKSVQILLNGLVIGGDCPQYQAGCSGAAGTGQIFGPGVFSDTQALALNSILTDSNGNIEKVTTAGTTGGSAPVWPVVVGNTVTSGTVTFTMEGTGISSGSITYSTGSLSVTTNNSTTATLTVNYISKGWGAGGTGIADEDGSHAWTGTNIICQQAVPAWQSTHVYALNTVIHDATSGTWQIVTTAGTSGGSVTFANSATQGLVVSDGTVKWTSLGRPVCGTEAGSDFGAINANSTFGQDVNDWLADFAGEGLGQQNTALKTLYPHVLSGCYDNIGVWNNPARLQVLQAAEHYCDFLFTAQTYDTTIDPQAKAKYSFMTQYANTLPIINFTTLTSSQSTIGHCGNICYSTQALRGAGYYTQISNTETWMSYSGTFQNAGSFWWTPWDFQGNNFGIATPKDNLYNGTEDVTASVSCTYVAFTCGSEALASWNGTNAITGTNSIVTANALWLVDPPTNDGPAILPGACTSGNAPALTNNVCQEPTFPDTCTYTGSGETGPDACGFGVFHATGGSSAALTSSIQGELNTQTACGTNGEIIGIPVNSFVTTSFALPVNGCGGAGKWIIIRADTADSNLPAAGVRIANNATQLANEALIGTTAAGTGAIYSCTVGQTCFTKAAVTPASYFWLGPGLDVTGSTNGAQNLIQIGSGNGATESSLANLPDHIVVDRDTIHSPSLTQNLHAGLGINGTNISVINNNIFKIQDVGAQGQGLYAVNGVGPFHIQNNYMECSAQCVIFGGADALDSATTGGTLPQDVTITQNWFHRNWSNWLGSPYYNNVNSTTTNLFEVKQINRFLFQGNLAEDNWSGYTQFGYAYVVDPKSTAQCTGCAVFNGTIRYNIVRHSQGWLSLATTGSTFGNGTPNSGMCCLSIHDNIALDLGTQYTKTGLGSVSDGAAAMFQVTSNNNIDSGQVHDVSILNNTMISGVNSTNTFATASMGGSANEFPFKNLTFKNNTFFWGSSSPSPHGFQGNASNNDCSAIVFTSPVSGVWDNNAYIAVPAGGSGQALYQSPNCGLQAPIPPIATVQTCASNCLTNGNNVYICAQYTTSGPGTTACSPMPLNYVEGASPPAPTTLRWTGAGAYKQGLLLEDSRGNMQKVYYGTNSTGTGGGACNSGASGASCATTGGAEPTWQQGGSLLAAKFTCDSGTLAASGNGDPCINSGVNTITYGYQGPGMAGGMTIYNTTTQLSAALGVQDGGPETGWQLYVCIDSAGSCFSSSGGTEVFNFTNFWLQTHCGSSGVIAVASSCLLGGSVGNAIETGTSNPAASNPVQVAPSWACFPSSNANVGFVNADRGQLTVKAGQTCPQTVGANYATVLSSLAPADVPFTGKLSSSGAGSANFTGSTGIGYNSGLLSNLLGKTFSLGGIMITIPSTAGAAFTCTASGTSAASLTCPAADGSNMNMNLDPNSGNTILMVSGSRFNATCASDCKLDLVWNFTQQNSVQGGPRLNTASIASGTGSIVGTQTVGASTGTATCAAAGCGNVVGNSATSTVPPVPVKLELVEQCTAGGCSFSLNSFGLHWL